LDHKTTPKLSALLWLCLVSLALCAQSCGEVACTAELRYAVTVHLTDADGQPVAEDGADVFYSRDGADPVACESLGESQWVCGSAAGSYTISAMSPQGQQAESTLKVGETSDGCHPRSQRVDLQLSEG
jgi:hypothetical protein